MPNSLTAGVENIDLSLQLSCPLQEVGYDYGMQSCVTWETGNSRTKIDTVGAVS